MSPENPVTFAEDVQIADVVDFSIRVDVCSEIVGDVLDAVLRRAPVETRQTLLSLR